MRIVKSCNGYCCYDKQPRRFQTLAEAQQCMNKQQAIQSYECHSTYYSIDVQCVQKLLIDAWDFELIREFLPVTSEQKTITIHQRSIVLYDFIFMRRSVYTRLWNDDRWWVHHRNGNQFDLRHENLVFVDPQFRDKSKIWPQIKYLTHTTDKLIMHCTLTDRKIKRIKNCDSPTLLHILSDLAEILHEERCTNALDYTQQRLQWRQLLNTNWTYTYFEHCVQCDTHPHFPKNLLGQQVSRNKTIC